MSTQSNHMMRRMKTYIYDFWLFDKLLQFCDSQSIDFTHFLFRDRLFTLRILVIRLISPSIFLLIITVRFLLILLVRLRFPIVDLGTTFTANNKLGKYFGIFFKGRIFYLWSLSNILDLNVA